MMALIEGYSCNRIKPLMDRANILIKLYFRTKHTRDKDNYAGFKGILDGLKKRVIRDDSSDKINVDWELLYDKDKPRTEIIVEEIG